MGEETRMSEVNDPEELAAGGGMLSQDELDSLLAAASAETPEGMGWSEPQASIADAVPEAPASAMPSAMPSLVDLPSFDMPQRSNIASQPEPSGLTRVKDIPLEVTVELGRTRLLIRDILDLGAGAIIELDKLAGEPVELFANGLMMALGEVIVIDDNFGVRVTEIITAAERGGKAPDALAA
jgi:flagellar motor switch protein FliN/FliY